jgi:selenocysteine lyase/cysteine desulfurase
VDAPSLAAIDENVWTDLRRAMPVCERYAYFDHAGVAPLPRPTADVMAAYAQDAAASGNYNWRQWQRRLEEARSLAARLIGAATDEMALVRNTTEGITLVAEGFPWREGDNVVLPECEFPSNRFAWQNLASRGVEARLVPCADGRLDLAELAKACDRRTRLIAVSWVDYMAGWRNDPAALAGLAHERGALLFLDAIQGLGMFSLDVRAAGIDFLAADGHKWLLGPEGAGVFYVRKEHLDLLRPIGVGWNSSIHAGDFTRPEMVLKPSAERYEGGTYPVATLVGLAESLRLLTSMPTAAIAARLLEITDDLCERLRRRGATIVSQRTATSRTDCQSVRESAEPSGGRIGNPSCAHSTDRRSGIVAFDLPGRDPADIRARCRAANVILNCRGGHVRVSPHVYNNGDDFDRLLAALGS